MTTWPTIKAPSLPTEEYPDPTIRGETDGGYIITRPRFTRFPRRWDLVWEALSHADYLTLMSFYTDDAVAGSVDFTWTCVTDDTAATVRFAGAPQARVVAWADGGLPKYWQVSVKLEEV